MNDTKSQSNKQKNQRQKTRQGEGSKKQTQNLKMLHGDRKHQDHEHPETRMTR
jgi:hypothetical protein